MGDFYHEEILKFREECKKTVEDAGVKIVPQEELDMDAFYASADEMLQKEYLSDEAYAAFVEDVKTTFGY